jgi:hypothetical protein
MVEINLPGTHQEETLGETENLPTTMMMITANGRMVGRTGE